ncbi:MAG: ABC-2 transporter permease [Nitrososphaerota archaeon]|jgi:hypothetical protein|nr:ABC-2 transporter permease [Nitrososphaerota archaeon]
MNWRNVRSLIRVERKSDRLLRGAKTTKFRERGIIAFWPYWLAAILGLIGGYLAKIAVEAIYSSPEAIMFPPLNEAIRSVFISLPAIVLIGCIFLTLMQQIQLAGMKSTRVVNYWLPITWQEHTLASIISNLLGFPFAIVIGFSAGILVFAAFNGLMLAALLTSLLLFGAAFTASATTEILRIVQTRFTGAVYKSSGKAAVWVRFAGTLFFFLIFYVAYFTIVGGPAEFLQSITNAQNTIWFVPFVWLGVALFYLLQGTVLEGVLFLGLAVLFMGGLYYLALALNKRFGLYEPPAITIQTKGSLYAPKTGLLGKLGFSSVEAAIIRKDIRSFTRRRELITTFIVPIVFVILPIFYSTTLSSPGTGSEVSVIYEVMIFFFPAAMMATLLGNMLIGEEGKAVWRIYASPVSPKNLVKAKYAFLILMSLLILIITGTVGAIFFRPSPELLVTAILGSIFLIFAVGAVGLFFGFKGADFTGGHRQRMIRQEWALVSLLVSAVTGLVILIPLAPFLLVGLIGEILPFTLPTMGLTELAIAIAVSGIIATVFTVIFYKINLNSAKELIRKAEI